MPDLSDVRQHMAKAERTTTTQRARERIRRLYPDDRSFWTGTEAITALAFGEAVPLATLNAQDEVLGRRWAEIPRFSKSEPVYLRVVEALGSQEGTDLAELGVSEQQVGTARYIQAMYTEETGRLIAFPKLAKMFREQWDGHKRRAELMEKMTAALLNAAAGGDIEMLGISDLEPSKGYVPVPPRILALALTIRNDRLEVRESASREEWAAASGVKTYHALRFNSADVRLLAERLSKVPGAKGARRQAHNAVHAKDLDPWILNFCTLHIEQTGKPVLAEVAQTALVREKNCTRAAARAAFDRLPPEVRNPANRPRKSPP